MFHGETTIAMTPSSRKSMVAQFFQKETENNESEEVQDTTVSIESESEEPEMVRGEMTIAMTPSSRKSMVAQFFENETEDQTSPDTIEIVEEDEVQIQGSIKKRFYLVKPNTFIAGKNRKSSSQKYFSFVFPLIILL